MKNRHRKILLLLLVIGTGALLARYVWMQVTFTRAQDNFIASVSPLIREMSLFGELDLSFLPSDLDRLTREVYEQPEQYISILKQSFAQAVENYNKTTSIPLIKELDIPTLLSSWSVEQKVAQLFVFGFEGIDLTENMRSFLEIEQPGGVILMGRNISAQLSGLITSIQSQANGMPFFVAVDQEGGPVVRIPEELPAQADLSLQEVCPTYLERSELLRKNGINLNFGIVADVSDDTTSFIYERVFRDEVASKITDAVHCTTETLSTLKHFPGHGITTDDSHLGVISVSIDREERESTHLPPFVAGIQAGVDAIMSAHLQISRIDPVLPVSLSVSGITLLREKGFDGLIVTDDLGMLRADYAEKEAIRLALLAGNDLILLVNPSDPETLLIHTAQLVRDGLFTQQELEKRVTRILRAKNKIIKLERYVPLELLR